MKTFITALLLAFVLTGCNSTSSNGASVTVDCGVPTSKKLNQAITQSQITLSQSQCYRQFNQHFDTLLAVAANEPSKGNKKAFRDYLVFAQNHGIIAKRQMQSLFTSHFSETFVSLSDKQSVCQVGKNLNRVASRLDAELAQKKLGLQDILGDNTSYYNATRQRESAILILAATAQACGSA